MYAQCFLTFRSFGPQMFLKKAKILLLTVDYLLLLLLLKFQILFAADTSLKILNSFVRWRNVFINPLQPGVAFLYPLKTSENLKVF